MTSTLLSVEPSSITSTSKGRQVWLSMACKATGKNRAWL
jgi:hypothetical protein